MPDDRIAVDVEHAPMFSRPPKPPPCEKEKEKESRRAITKRVDRTMELCKKGISRSELVLRPELLFEGRPFFRYGN